MKNIRNEAVAGLFYPENATQLKKMINNHLAQVELKQKFNGVIGAVVPHAGYYYSGDCAAYGYRAISTKNFKTAIIVAPSHKFDHFNWSIGDYDYYHSPLGNMKVDRVLTAKLMSALEADFLEEVHEVEHSLEVQIPFLQYIKPDCEIVPIILGRQGAENSVRLAEEIYKLISKQPEDFVVLISSDLSHYHHVNKAMILDNLIMKNIENLDIEKISEDYFQHRLEACGIGGILMMMHLAKMMNLQVKNLKYTNSSEVSGEERQVVGYLSSLFYQSN